ncbi:MAG: asparaginase [Christensenellaceae bacterium]|nr:asparaginase [Christensenellaceae bacterium]
MEGVELIKQYRGDLLECIHRGRLTIVSEKGVELALGDENSYAFYRSASKPIQSLPVVIRHLPEKYGLTDTEAAILSGSHWAQKQHVEALESIIAKTGLKEEDMIMLPTYPRDQEMLHHVIKNDLPKRKIYHNCSGKHLGIMLLARELGEEIGNYWKIESKAQGEILKVISMMTDTPVSEIKIGTDGCGVPVYAAPMKNLARSYLKLACPDMIEDDDLREAVIRNRRYIHTAPYMMDATGQASAVIDSVDDLIGKDGALGFYALGISSKRLGIAVKINDGNDQKAVFSILNVLRQLGYDEDLTNRLAKVTPDTIVNDNKITVGYQEAVFKI